MRWPRAIRIFRFMGYLPLVSTYLAVHSISPFLAARSVILTSGPSFSFFWTAAPRHSMSANAEDRSRELHLPAPSRGCQKQDLFDTLTAAEDVLARLESPFHGHDATFED